MFPPTALDCVHNFVVSMCSGSPCRAESSVELLVSHPFEKDFYLIDALETAISPVLNQVSVNVFSANHPSCIQLPIFSSEGAH